MDFYPHVQIFHLLNASLTSSSTSFLLNVVLVGYLETRNVRSVCFHCDPCCTNLANVSPTPHLGVSIKFLVALSSTPVCSSPPNFWNFLTASLRLVEALTALSLLVSMQ